MRWQVSPFYSGRSSRCGREESNNNNNNNNDDDDNNNNSEKEGELNPTDIAGAHSAVGLSQRKSRS